MNNQRLFLDLHILQTLPPANINRDDTGSPKTAQYGGVRRARVSSQSWKKAMRDYFVAHSAENNVGKRSLEIVAYIASLIRKLDGTIDQEQSMKMADDIINKAGVKTKDFKMKALFFLGHEQAVKLAKAALDHVDNKSALQEMLKSAQAIDIALFGRMVADDPYLNEDASSQVAHAISTHAIQNEFDFYTAVDDLSSEDSAGAGMLGTIEFNSATLYRYANVAIHELVKQLGNKESVVKTLQLFIKAFSNSLPTGKVNTFANQTLPQLLVLSLRKDRPVNMVSAFENPVKAKNGYINESGEKLNDEFKKIEKFAEKPIVSMYVTTSTMESENFGKEKESLDEMLHDFAITVEELLVTEGE